MDHDPTRLAKKIQDMLSERIRQHGRAVQAVGSTNPLDVPFAYTIGNHPKCPELILFGFDPKTATGVLNRVSDEHAGRIRRVAGKRTVEVLTLTDPKAPGWSLRARLSPVDPQWVAAFPHQARRWHRASPQELPFVQLEVADKNGRLPGEKGADETYTRVTPDLSGQSPFPFPSAASLSADAVAIEVLLAGAPDADRVVLLPVSADVPDVGPVWQGTYEAVRAVAVPGGVRVAAPPVASGVAAVGDVVATVPHISGWHPAVDNPDGLSVEVGTGVVERSGRVTNEWHVKVGSDAEIDVVDDVLLRMVDECDDVSMVWHLGGVVISTPPDVVAKRDRRLRVLQRDGVLQPASGRCSAWPDGIPVLPDR